MGKRELVALLNLSTWCLVMVERLFLAVPQGCLRFVIVVLPDHTHLLFLLLCAISLGRNIQNVTPLQFVHTCRFHIFTCHVVIHLLFVLF